MKKISQGKYELFTTKTDAIDKFMQVQTDCESVENFIKDSYTKGVFDEFLSGDVTDHDVLRLGTEIIKWSRDLLDSDLDNPQIKKEYDDLNKICNELEHILNNYV